MLYPSIRRIWDGIHIEGEQIVLQLHPRAEGTLNLCVIAMPALTGFGAPCRLWGEERDLAEFAPHEIVVHDTRLECFAGNRYASFLRAGLVLDIEPGMAQQLRAWLPKLIAVASASKSIADKFNTLLPAPIYHMLGAIPSVLARIVLDKWAVNDSVAFERRHGVWRDHQDFMGQFDNEGVMQDLHAALPLAGTT